MSRATISVPVSDSRVLIGWRDRVWRISLHRSLQIDRHDLAAQGLLVDLRQETGGVALQFLEEHARPR